MIKIRLREIAENNGLTTVKSVVDATAVSDPTVRRWWIGLGITRIETDVLEKFCAYFNCTPGDLLEYTPDPE